VRYIRLPKLFAELAVARVEGTYRKTLVQYKKVKLLILDEWRLYPLKDTESRDLLEIAESRCKNKGLKKTISRETQQIVAF
jgi:DNA replication protein DnaC